MVPRLWCLGPIITRRLFVSLTLKMQNRAHQIDHFLKFNAWHCLVLVHTYRWQQIFGDLENFVHFQSIKSTTIYQKQDFNNSIRTLNMPAKQVIFASCLLSHLLAEMRTKLCLMHGLHDTTFVQNTPKHCVHACCRTNVHQCGRITQQTPTRSNSV